MASLFASGRVADLIIGLMIVEWIVLTLIHRRTGRGVPPAELSASLAAGGSLVYALRAALSGAPWSRIATWLALALAAHAAYLALRSDSNRLS